MNKVHNIGIAVNSPKTECDDKHCVFHGNVKIRGREFKGTVVRSNAQKTVVVEWERLFFIEKYQRYEKRKSRLQVHNPACLNVKAGDVVRIVESRPISKTKNFVVVERIE
jgi:small subunit ribosomal protein S17